MRTSGAGIRFIQSFEKLCLIVYLDEGGRKTVGYGHLVTQGEDLGNSVTQDQADQLFLSDLYDKAEKPVNNAIFGLDIRQNQFDGLVSLCYNIGSGNFVHSTLLKVLKAGNTETAAEQFLVWDHVNGKVSDGLYARRVAERNIFENGVYNNHL